METIFYLLVVVCLFVEIIELLAVKRVANGVRKYKGVTDPKEYSPIYVAFGIFNLSYFFLCLVGLMSSQWICFLALLLLSFIPKRWIVWRVSDGIIGIAILVFILLNKYHFHIDFNLLTIKFLFA